MRKPATESSKRRGKREAERLFQIGAYWLGVEKTGTSIYYYWYDAGTGSVRRRPTGCGDLDDAKLWLSKLVITQPPEEPLHPDVVTISQARKFYMTHHGDHIRAKPGVVRSFNLVTTYLKKVCRDEGAPKVGQFTLAQQHGFMRWCRDEHELSCKTISTYLSYFKAGLKFASVPRLIKDARGFEREARVLAFVPFIQDGEEQISKITGLPRSQPRDWIPTDGELARTLDCIEHEHVWRYCITALNTWARPEAICELNVKTQVDMARRLIFLNPPGRPQNKKIRPMIRLTDNLMGWLLTWDREFPIHDRAGQRIAAINNKTLKKAAKRAGVEQWDKFTRYTFRHYMATRVRRVEGVKVEREERATWLGHTDPNHSTTESWYESLDPDYLLNAAKATDAIMLMLSQITRNKLVSPMQLPSEKLTLLKANDK